MIESFTSELIQENILSSQQALNYHKDSPGFTSCSKTLISFSENAKAQSGENCILGRTDLSVRERFAQDSTSLEWL
jgi:hypothetical protein